MNGPENPPNPFSAGGGCQRSRLSRECDADLHKLAWATRRAPTYALAWQPRTRCARPRSEALACRGDRHETSRGHHRTGRSGHLRLGNRVLAAFHADQIPPVPNPATSATPASVPGAHERPERPVPRESRIPAHFTADVGRVLIGDRDRPALLVGAVMRPVLHPQPGVAGRERNPDAHAVPRSALTVVASGEICENVVVVPWA
jgi:hypothetical protein